MVLMQRKNVQIHVGEADVPSFKLKGFKRADLAESHEVGGEEKSGADMGELDRAVRERAEALEAQTVAEATTAKALKAQEEAEAEAAEAKKIAEESAAALRAANECTAQTQSEVERIQAEKKALEAELKTLRGTGPAPTAGKGEVLPPARKNGVPTPVDSGKAGGG